MTRWQQSIDAWSELCAAVPAPEDRDSAVRAAWVGAVGPSNIPTRLLAIAAIASGAIACTGFKRLPNGGIGLEEPGRYAVCMLSAVLLGVLAVRQHRLAKSQRERIRVQQSHGNKFLIRVYDDVVEAGIQGCLRLLAAGVHGSEFQEAGVEIGVAPVHPQRVSEAAGFIPPVFVRPGIASVVGYFLTPMSLIVVPSHAADIAGSPVGLVGRLKAGAQRLGGLKPKVRFSKLALLWAAEGPVDEIGEAVQNVAEARSAELFFSEFVNIDASAGGSSVGTIELTMRDGRRFQLTASRQFTTALSEAVRAAKPGGAPDAAHGSHPDSVSDAAASDGTMSAPEVIPSVAVRICPMCAETIKAAARICRYCRHEF